MSSPARSCDPAVAAVLPGPRWFGCGGNGLGAVELGREVAMPSIRWLEMTRMRWLKRRAPDEVEVEDGRRVFF